MNTPKSGEGGVRPSTWRCLAGSRHADLVVFLTGTNDFLEMNGVPTWLGGIVKLHRAASPVYPSCSRARRIGAGPQQRDQHRRGPAAPGNRALEGAALCWDLWAAIGERDSMNRFHDVGLGSPTATSVHQAAPGWASAWCTLRDLQAHLGRHPTPAATPSEYGARRAAPSRGSVAICSGPRGAPPARVRRGAPRVDPTNVQSARRGLRGLLREPPQIRRSRPAGPSGSPRAPRESSATVTIASRKQARQRRSVRSAPIALRMPRHLEQRVLSITVSGRHEDVRVVTLPRGSRQPPVERGCTRTRSRRTA